MQKLDETSLALFKDTPSKKFLIDVINDLADHGHVSIDAINKKDEEQSLVWNWLNKAASTFSVDRIIKLLQRLNLFTESKSVDDLPVLTEYRMFTPRHEDEDAKKVRETQKKVRDDQRALLLQIQLATYDLIKNAILDKVPSAKYVQFKNGAHYIGKIVYETDHNGDEAGLWFRNDGLIVCSTEDPSSKKTNCYTDAEVDAWIEAHPAAEKFEGTNITPENVQQVAKIIVDCFNTTRSNATSFTPFKKQDKVLGIQKVFIPSIGEVEIWYRSTQGVFCKSRAGYKEILSVEKLTEYLQKLVER
jgi:hypothetical protein